MDKYCKPIIIVSKCLGFDECRYNGVSVPCSIVSELRNHVDFITVCPEVEIGLGIPRKPIHIILQDASPRLLQHETNRDITDEMNAFSVSFLKSLNAVDGFILKGRSPSCGIKDVKLKYPGGNIIAGSHSGIFAQHVLEMFPDIPAETEGRLTNFSIREYFYTRIFALARFRQMKESGVLPDYMQFHADHKFLLLAYNEKEMRIMGKILANQSKRPLNDVYELYGIHLKKALGKMPRFTSHINVLLHLLGYVSEHLNSHEKAYFLDCIEKFRTGTLPLSAPVAVLKSHIARLNIAYLKTQTYFAPYPESLITLHDSGKGR
ncbi:MAG: DUF1722 domain-containing protein [bacterium]|nr:DUF1722 domain-containing protein [bacterium]